MESHFYKKLCRPVQIVFNDLIDETPMAISVSGQLLFDTNTMKNIYNVIALVLTCIRKGLSDISNEYDVSRLVTMDIVREAGSYMLIELPDLTEDGKALSLDDHLAMSHEQVLAQAYIRFEAPSRYLPRPLGLHLIMNNIMNTRESGNLFGELMIRYVDNVYDKSLRPLEHDSRLYFRYQYDVDKSLTENVALIGQQALDQFGFHMWRTGHETPEQALSHARLYVPDWAQFNPTQLVLEDDMAKFIVMPEKKELFITFTTDEAAQKRMDDGAP